jgi:hypothetical protein
MVSGGLIKKMIFKQEGSQLIIWKGTLQEDSVVSAKILRQQCA